MRAVKLSRTMNSYILQEINLFRYILLDDFFLRCYDSQ
jgi:hypothetical protein